MKPSPPLASLVFGVVAALSGCGPGGVLPVGQPTVASAIADKAPLVVDWPAGQRTDLEVTAHDGVAVVQVEPRSIKLLRDCHLAGSYGFLGVSTKEQLIRLEDAGEVALNLPLRGVGLAGELGGELGTSTALDVALVTIGRRRTIRTSAPRSALTGSECRTATHYIRGFDVGAFVLTTSEKSQVSTVAGLFGAHAAYARKSGKSVHEADGSLDACKGVQPGDKAPPKGCSAALRLDLKALDEDEGVADASCGEGLVRVEGKCTTKAKVASGPARVAFECDPRNEDECRAQCEAGSASSCASYAQALRHSLAKAPDFKVLREVAERGCSGGAARACVALGELSQYGNGIPVDPKRAAELYEQACANGEPLGCFLLGALYDRRPGLPVDYAKASELYDRACRGGLADGCNNLGALAVAGHGTGTSPEKARAIYEGACNDGSEVACGNLGDLHADGLGGPKDPVRAAELWSRACAKSGYHCIRLGDATSGAGPLPKDPMRSVEAYQRGMKRLSAQCNLGVAERCDDLGWLFHDGRAVPRDDAQALVFIRKACDRGSPEGCHHVAMFLERGWGVAQDKLEAERQFKQSCDAGNLRACVSFARIASGPEAKGRQAFIERACEGGVSEGCYHQARLERLAAPVSLPSSDAGKRLERACTEGYVPACAYLGRWQRRAGDAAEKDLGMAHLETACEKADLGACASVAEVLLTTTGAERGKALARRACDGGIARGCSVLAELAGGAGASEGALRQRACDGGELAACARLAEGVSATEPGRAATLLQRACDVASYSPSMLTSALAGHIATRSAAVETGPVGARIGRSGSLSAASSASLSQAAEQLQMQMLAALSGGSVPVLRASEDRSGTGALTARLITRDPVELIRVIDRADAGEPTGEDRRAGCVALGEMHERGQGFAADARAAERFYGVSCAHTEGKGCTRLAAIEERAKTKDRAKIGALYARACELGDGEGCLRSGVIAAASSSKAERAEAPDSFEMACQLGSAEGCLRAGAINESDRHFEHALELFDKACASKEVKGCAAATKLRPRVETARAAAEKLRPTVAGRKGNVVVGGVTATAPVADADRVIAGLRARLRVCYQTGLTSAPTQAGRVVLQATLAPNGEVSRVDVATVSGLSTSVAQCAAGVVKRATFSPPGGKGSTLSIPLVCTPES